MKKLKLQQNLRKNRINRRLSVSPVQVKRQNLHTRIAFFLVVWFCFMAGFGCTSGSPTLPDDGRLRIVATTSMIADLVRTIGGKHTHVTGLMGPGIDPHLYKASEGDVSRMAGAELIFYNGLHLEGKMVDIFEQMNHRGKKTFAMADALDNEDPISSPNFAGNYDPHIWFDVTLWMKTTQYVRDMLIQEDGEHAETYRTNAEAYLDSLQTLHGYLKAQAERVPAPQRVLVTAHDAFSYFGRAYGFEVRGLQGLSTASEAGTSDVQNLVDFIVDRRIPAMFVESSVPPRSIEAVQAAVRSRGFDVKIGGYLFSDALGNPDTPEGTYIGTVRHNINTIVEALLGNENTASS